MRRSFALVGLALTAICVLSEAAPRGKRNHGGLGYLFPDANTFANPSQFASHQGSAVETFYNRESGSSQQQSLTASATYGKSHFGFGAYVTRAGTSLTLADASSDSAGIAVGVGLVRDTLNLGVGYSRSVDSGATDNGIANVSLSLLSKGRGLCLAVGATSTLGGSSVTQAATVSLGYQFDPNLTWEIVLNSANLSSLNNANPSTFLRWENRLFYLGLGYTFVRSSAKHSGQFRAGGLLGSFDVSVHGSQVFDGGATMPYYGVSARVVF